MKASKVSRKPLGEHEVMDAKRRLRSWKRESSWQQTLPKSEIR